MAEARFVAGDWGTSHLRLFLCDETGAALDMVAGPGAAGVAGQFAHIYDELTQAWRARRDTLPAVLCGMVGSSLGWAQTPYVACPARLEQIGGGCVAVHDGRVHIVPGLSCRNRLDAPDFMRGEETQILGALHLDGNLRAGRRLLCLPGTHTKWVALDDGEVREFMTAPTGEVFAALSRHSVLVRTPTGADAEPGGAAFARGLAAFNEKPHAQLLHRLFECRSRLLSGELSAPSTSAFLSGLLIASDISGALQLMSGAGADGKVHLIGSSELATLYAAGLAALDYDSQSLDGSAASLAGLAQVHQQMARGTLAHAAV